MTVRDMLGALLVIITGAALYTAVFALGYAGMSPSVLLALLLSRMQGARCATVQRRHQRAWRGK